MTELRTLDDAQQRALLESLLPHRDPILLLDRLRDVGQEFASAEVLVTGNSAFYRPELGGVPTWVGLEYMAQTVAAWSGQQLLDLGRPIAIGFLLGTRAYRTQLPVFTPGMRLQIDITVTYAEPSGLSSFDCTIYQVESSRDDGENGPVLAEARINAFRPDDPLSYVREGINTLMGEIS